MHHVLTYVTPHPAAGCPTDRLMLDPPGAYRGRHRADMLHHTRTDAAAFTDFQRAALSHGHRFTFVHEWARDPWWPVRRSTPLDAVDGPALTYTWMRDRNGRQREYRAAPGRYMADRRFWLLTACRDYQPRHALRTTP